MTEPLEVASSSLTGLSKALVRAGLLDEVLAALPEPARAAMKAPNEQRWWPGSMFSEINRVIIRLRGMEVYEQICNDLVRRGLGPIAEPLVKVTVALLGATPGLLLSRMGSLAGVSMKGPTFEWKAADKNHGTLTVKYLAPIDAPPIVAGWKATFQYLFELSKPGKLEKISVVDNSTTFVFEFSW